MRTHSPSLPLARMELISAQEHSSVLLVEVFSASECLWGCCLTVPSVCLTGAGWNSTLIREPFQRVLESCLKIQTKEMGRRGRNWQNDCPLAFVLLGRGSLGHPKLSFSVV